MAFFEYREGQLCVESVPLNKIAQQLQTPVYCYSSAAIVENYQSYAEQFGQEKSMICYAVKANSNQTILALLGKLGAGADVVSQGELKRALLAGIPAKRIVYSGVAKTASEMRYALQQDIFQFNVESEQELELLNQVALAAGKRAPVAFRINPDIDAKTHAKISTGKASNKFGIPASRALDTYARAAALPGINVQGIDMHIGSQLTELEPFKHAFACLAELTTDLRLRGIEISVIDIGGGLGICYDKKAPKPPTLADYANLANDILGSLNCRILVEPGRSIVGDTGVLLSEVIYIKHGDNDSFLIIDAGMNDLLRPSMYDAFHEILPVRVSGTDKHAYQVVGPICETGDTFARNRELPVMENGDLVAIMSSGAYGAVMASSYNSRPLVPEVLVKDETFKVIRRRPSFEEMIELDTTG